MNKETKKKYITNLTSQLESVAEIGNFQCIDMFQYIETLYIDMFQYVLFQYI